mgnify:CR=1 FL=1
MFGCGKELAWIYILAELLAALLACSIFGETLLLLCVCALYCARLVVLLLLLGLTLEEHYV